MKGKNKRRFNKFVSIGLIATLTASFCVGMMQSSVIGDTILSSFAAEASNDDIGYEFNEKDSTLTLSGSIEMPDYTAENTAPWGEYKDSAEKIVIEDGIRSVGDNAFVSFSDLSEVTVPQSVTEISDNAFVDCKDGFTIKGIADSAADTFAERNQYNFEALDTAANPDTDTSDSSTTSTTSTTSAVTTTTTTAAPADSTIPTGLSVTCETYNKLKISWDKVDGAVGYYLYCATAEDGKYSVAKYVNSGDITSYVHSSRTYEKVYYYKIKSYEVINGQKVFSPDSVIVSGRTHVDPPAVVQNVTVKCTDYNKLTISWDNVEDAAGYYVYWADAPDGQYRLAKNITRSTTTEFIHTGRTYEKMYYYKVVSYNKAGSKAIPADDSEIVSGRTHVDPPAVVQNVTVKCTDYNKLKISWDKVDDAKAYYVYWADAPDGQYRLAKNITRSTTTEFVHTGRTYEKMYYYKVVAYNTAGSKAICADASDIVSGRTHIDPPAVVQNVNVTCTAYNQLSVSWDKVDDAKAYYVYWAETPDGKYSLAKNITRNTTTQFIHSGRKLGVTYYYKVVAYNTAGHKVICGDESEVVSCTTYLHIPSAPTVTARTDGTMYITFTKVTGAYKYNVYRSADGGEFVRVAVTSSNKYIDQNAVPGKTYAYKLASVRDDIVTECSPAASGVCTLATPNISSASPTNYNSVAVKWNRVANATEYKIYQSTEKNGDYICAGTVNSRTYTFTASGLDTGTTYYFKVAAGKTFNGETGYSDMSSVKSATPTLSSVTKISGSCVGKSAIFVEWTNVAGADGYELYGAESGESMELLEDCDKYYYSHKELTGGQKYTYNVRAYRIVNGSKLYSSCSKTITVTMSKTLSTATYAWSYSHKVTDNQTPEAVIKAQEKASNINTLFVGDTTRKVIYLTMDCGYPSEHSDTNLDTLKEKNVKATFFIALPYAKGSHEQIQRMIDEGHIVANHTKNHIRLTRAKPDVVRSEVKALEDYIYNNFNYRTKYFRYPYGSFSQASQNELIEMGYTSVGWSFAYNDFSTPQPKPAYALNLVTQNIHPGAIFLLHMNSSTNTAILGDFIDKAREMGYEFETLDDIEI